MSGCPDYLPSEGGSAISTLGEAENRHIGKPEAAIKPLEVAFRAYDHDLRQIWREGQIAIFERSLPGREPHEFELVVIRTQKESTLPNGSVLPAREAYPGSSQWGERGWAFPIRNRQLAFELARRMAASKGAPGSGARLRVRGPRPRSGLCDRDFKECRNRPDRENKVPIFGRLRRRRQPGSCLP